MDCDCPKCRKAIRRTRVRCAVGVFAALSLAALYVFAPTVKGLLKW